MDVNTGADGSLVLSYDSTRLSRAIFVFAGALFAAAGYHLLSERGDTEWLIGFLGGSVTCLLVALALLEQAHVVVDPAARSLVWRRRFALRTLSGSLAFDDISAVYAERSTGGDRVPSRRLVIGTRNGETIPLTAGYRPDADQVILRASEQIRAVLGPQPASGDTAQAMVKAGRIVEAIAFLRESEGLSPTGAKRRIDALRGSGSGTGR